jgi:DNA-binding NtrC family response regulator
MRSMRKILFVDDEPDVLAAFSRNLRKRFLFDTATSGSDALRLIRLHGPYAVIVSDIMMPGMRGEEMLEQLTKFAPNTVRVVLTSSFDKQTVLDAINRGRVFRFLNKPCPSEDLVKTLEECLEKYEKHLAETEQSA